MLTGKLIQKLVVELFHMSLIQSEKYDNGRTNYAYAYGYSQYIFIKILTKFLYEHCTVAQVETFEKIVKEYIKEKDINV